MKNVTLVLQGKVTKETIEFYRTNYPLLPTVISTWFGMGPDTSNLPDSYKVVLAKMPEKRGSQNQNLQFTSTLNGLNQVETDYVIKLRGDEYYSNLEYVLQQVESEPDKIHCTPVWFRHWSFMKYHISDHLIAGKTENLKKMFSASKHNFDNTLLTYIKNKKPQVYWEPEIHITRSYLREVDKDDYELMDGRVLMAKHFSILKLPLMKPYKIIANLFNKTWTEDYIPEKNFSISDIRMIFNPKSKAYDTDIS